MALCCIFLERKSIKRVFSYGLFYSCKLSLIIIDEKQKQEQENNEKHTCVEKQWKRQECSASSQVRAVVTPCSDKKLYGRTLKENKERRDDNAIK